MPWHESWFVAESFIVIVTGTVAVPLEAMLVPNPGLGVPAAAVNQEAKQPDTALPWAFTLPLASLAIAAPSELNACAPLLLFVMVKVRTSLPVPGRRPWVESVGDDTVHVEAEPTDAEPVPVPVEVK